MKTTFKHFANEADATAWAITELLATLRDDLVRMEGYERKHYTNEDRKTMREKISDIAKLETILATNARAEKSTDGWRRDADGTV